MLRLLLDEHLSPDLVAAVQAMHPDLFLTSIHAWEDGQYRGVDDSLILAAAYEQGLSLVTYDQKTIMPLLTMWGEAGIAHAGVIFGHSRTILTSDIACIIHDGAHCSWDRRHRAGPRASDRGDRLEAGGPRAGLPMPL